MKTRALTVLLLTWAVVAPAGEAVPPKFTTKPTVTKAGDRVKIEFAVDRETDVAVFIENDGGKIVRHLVAGVLGKNPPLPLKPGLAQSVEWDGRADYGKAAGAGPFRVRVALGLGARYDKVVAEDRQNFGNVKSLAVGPDGTLYVCASFGAAVPNWSGERIVAVGRDGKYLRTVMPYPADLPKEKTAGFGTVEIEGRAVPVWKTVPDRSFYAGDSLRKAGMAVTADGVILKPIGGYRCRGPMSLQAIGADGGCPWGTDGGPQLMSIARPAFGRPFVCVSSDGKHAYLSGLSDVTAKKSFAAVYRVKLPERAPCEPFYGRPDEPGSGEGQLSGSPRGLATDGKGTLYIADQANDRIVAVDEKTGKAVGTIKVAKPDCLAVDGATGAVYVTSLGGRGAVDLIKFRGLKDASEAAKLALKGEGNPDFPWVMALDAGAKPPILWLGSDSGSLLRVEDGGASFASAKVNTGKFGNCAFVDLDVDRFRPDPEVYWRCGQGSWYRLSEKDGEIENVRLQLPSAAGSCLKVGPDGHLYAAAYAYHLLRFTRDGKPAPWAEGVYPKEHLGKDGKVNPIKPGPAHGFFLPVSMTFMTHTVGVRHDSRIFAFEPGHPGDRPPKMLREYLPSGKRVSEEPIIWKVSDVAVGPEFDQQGNIYIAEQIKPLDQPYPPEFAALVGKVEPGKTYLEKEPMKNAICTMYGSIVKFSPNGGTIHFGGENPYVGEAKLDPSLKTVEMGSYSGYRMHPLKITGAEWVRMGISHVDLHYCNCESTRFDVDGFGRVWYPDLGRFRVVVLDTAGNEIAHFGGYGNADDSLRTADSGLRIDGNDSRRDQGNDPKSALRNPQSAIHFAWLIGVGATDRYAYMGDSMNRRMLRAKLVYAAEETVTVP